MHLQQYPISTQPHVLNTIWHTGRTGLSSCCPDGVMVAGPASTSSSTGRHIAGIRSIFGCRAAQGSCVSGVGCGDGTLWILRAGRRTSQHDCKLDREVRVSVHACMQTLQTDRCQSLTQAYLMPSRGRLSTCGCTSAAASSLSGSPASHVRHAPYTPVRTAPSSHPLCKVVRPTHGACTLHKTWGFVVPVLQQKNLQSMSNLLHPELMQARCCFNNGARTTIVGLMDRWGSIGALAPPAMLRLRRLRDTHGGGEVASSGQACMPCWEAG